MAFKDTDRTVFVARRGDGSIYGVWTVRQFAGQEEVLADDPQVVAFMNRPAPQPGISGNALADLLIAKGIVTEQDVTTAATMSAGLPLPG